MVYRRLATEKKEDEERTDIIQDTIPEAVKSARDSIGKIRKEVNEVRDEILDAATNARPRPQPFRRFIRRRFFGQS